MLEIILVVSAIVIVLGAIFGWKNLRKGRDIVKGEATAYIDKKSKNTKVVRVKVANLRKKGIKLAQSCRSLYITIEKSDRRILQLQTQSGALLSEAKAYKASNNRPMAEAKIAMKAEIDNQILELQNTNKKMRSQMNNLEITIERIKGQISKIESSLEVLSAKEDLVDLTKTVSGSSNEAGGDSINEAIAEIGDGLDFDIDNLNSKDLAEVAVSPEVSKAYEEL